MAPHDELILRRADDFHVHLRQGEVMALVAPLVHAGGAGRCIAMPNTVPPLTTARAVVEYRDALSRLEPRVEFLASLYLTAGLTSDEVHRATDAGVAGVKCYPRGVTTNSGAGVEDLMAYGPVFAAMQERDMVLQVHAEAPSNASTGISIMNAEEAFLSELGRLHASFPNLRIVLEHVSSAAGVAWVERMDERVAATVTLHHLTLTVDDWAGRCHNYTKPVAKLPSDREAIGRVVIAGHSRFFLGSDSAPHPRADKEGVSARPGIFTTPILMPALAERFEQLGCLDRLNDFASLFGRRFYGLPELDAPPMRLVRRPWLVPASYGTIVPFRADETLTWTISP